MSTARAVTKSLQFQIVTQNLLTPPNARHKIALMNEHGSKWIRPEKRLAIYIRDSFACAYCGTDLRNSRPAEVTLDHLTPRSLGGTNDATNLVTACRTCNSSRGNRSLESFAPGGSLVRIAKLIAQPLNVKLARAIIDDRTNERVEAAR